MNHRQQTTIRFALALVLLASVVAAFADVPESEVDRRVEVLLRQMTLDEKIGQLNQLAADVGDDKRFERLLREGRLGSVLDVEANSVRKSALVSDRNAVIRSNAEFANRLQKIAVEESRLHIPLLIAHDVIHGYRTMFPVPLAEASSFDPDLAERTAAAAAREARAVGVLWTFAPMVDIARDPRWGRIVEGSGEDPYLGCRMAAARVRGFQGSSFFHGIMATAKHYVAYGAAEGGRDYNTADVSERTLREVYLPPFLAAVNAHVASIMVAFDDLGGEPASANSFTVKQILRGDWGYDGIVVSDWNSIEELQNHGVAADEAEAAALAFNVGVDVDMVGESYIHTLADLVKRGVVSLSAIDAAVRRVLRAKMELGLFEHPYVDVPGIDGALFQPDAVALARRAADESIVLLKNQDRILPLRKNLTSLAIIGPLADDREAMLGSWNCAGVPEDVVTLRQALTAALPHTRVTYARGCDVSGTNRGGFDLALAAARAADAVVLMVGESASMTGEAESRGSLDLPGVQGELAQRLLDTGKPLVLVLANGRPLTLGTLADRAPAIVESWFLGVQAGPAIADVLLGDYNPAGRLPVTFPRSVGQIPLYYNHKNGGRPKISRYIDISNEPQYSFGFGLSYTSFAYDNLQISPREATVGGAVRISVDVNNRGKRAGDEVVQLYLHHLVASTSRPVLQLDGFQRIRLAAGETRTVTFDVGAAELSMVNAEMRRVVEPGGFDVLVGPSSASGLRGHFEVRRAP